MAVEHLEERRTGADRRAFHLVGMDARWERIAASSGIAFFVLTVVSFALTPSYPTPGSTTAEIVNFALEDRTMILASTAVGGLGIAALFWFLGSLRRALGHSGWRSERLSTVMFGAGIAVLGMVLVNLALYSTIAYSAAEVAGGEVVVRTLWDMSLLTQSIAGFPWAVFLGAAALAALESQTVPRWLGYAAGVLSAAVLASSIGSMFADAGSVVMAPNGAVPSIVLGLFGLWIVAMSITLMRRPA